MVWGRDVITAAGNVQLSDFLRNGKCIVFDDVGVGIKMQLLRDRSKEPVVMNHLIQQSRHHQYRKSL